MQKQCKKSARLHFTFLGDFSFNFGTQAEEKSVDLIGQTNYEKVGNVTCKGKFLKVKTSGDQFSIKRKGKKKH